MSIPSDEELRKHGMLGRYEVILKTPLKWVLLILWLFALAVYWLVGYMYDDRMENLIDRKHRQTDSTAIETRKRWFWNKLDKFTIPTFPEHMSMSLPSNSSLAKCRVLACIFSLLGMIRKEWKDRLMAQWEPSAGEWILYLWKNIWKEDSIPACHIRQQWHHQS